jgi:hypothetical protein
MSEESMNNALDGLYRCEKSIFTGADPELSFTLYITNFSL